MESNKGSNNNEPDNDQNNEKNSSPKLKKPEIIRILKKNIESWKDINEDEIEMDKQIGMTNQT